MNTNISQNIHPLLKKKKRKKNWREHLPTHSMRSLSPWYQKQTKNIIIKEIYTPKSLINTDAKITNKLNASTHRKDYAPWPSRINPSMWNWFYIQILMKCPMSLEQRIKSHGHLSRYKRNNLTKSNIFSWLKNPITLSELGIYWLRRTSLVWNRKPRKKSKINITIGGKRWELYS